MPKNVFVFGPGGMKPMDKKEASASASTSAPSVKDPVNIRVRIDLRDTWSTHKKILPLPENVLGKNLELPLNLHKKDNVFHVDGREILVTLRDKPDESFRRVNQYDLEVLVDLDKVNVSREITIHLPEPVRIWWNGEKDGKELWQRREKGFLVEQKGLLKEEGKGRGDLLVRINMVSLNPDSSKVEGERKEEMLEPKWILDEHWRERYDL
jgi:hypothetical protein